MSVQEFVTFTGGETGLLRQVEEIVVEAHRGLYLKAGREWSRPAAYHWLRYEDPMPLERLAEGVEKLRRLGAAFDPIAVDKACAEAVAWGFSN